MRSPSKHGLFGIWSVLLCGWLLTACQFAATVPNDIVQLTLWHGINPPPNRDIFNELVEVFNAEHPQIEVRPLYVGQPDQQLPKILTAVVGDAPPNLLWFGPSITGQLVELGALRPIEDWFANSQAKAKLDPSLLDGMTLDGRIWSIPMAANNVGLFYRPSLLEAAGVTELPDTWEELRRVAEQLTEDLDGDGTIDRYGLLLPLGKGEWTVFAWLPFLYGTGGEIIDGDRPNLFNSEAIAALQFWADLVADGSVALSQPERGYELDDFLKGRVAMQLTGPWTLGQLEQTGVDYAAIPIPAGTERATVVGGEHLFVTRTTPREENAALEFLDFVLSDRFQIQWALGTGYLPASLSARHSQRYRAYVAERPLLDVFLKQMSWARSRPILPNYARLSNSLGRAIEQTLLGRDPATALEDAQQRIELVWPEDASSKPSDRTARSYH
ncbi:sugar ABC transporter substrate-binding protein [Leptolyngbya valderiana BDU 20041]|nr:ABC transporter substrate-binding protein [Geitlerinema sp. CS-897]OAB60750.1 sugar ABC transporter substrate-binding protein [Leptolyngbya valderiana BDU 20041]PPT07250.1 N-Acetyl-D-glucosamine ABC transport system sugar-binding protein [Geitlerinema sp. FC II]